MAAGRVGGGGGRGGGRVGGPKGSSGAGGASKAGAGFKADQTAPAAGAVVSGGTAPAGAMEPATLRALEIAQALRQGTIESKRKATERLVEDILRRKLRTKSAALTGRITDALQDDPHVNQLLERLWAKG